MRLENINKSQWYQFPDIPNPIQSSSRLSTLPTTLDPDLNTCLTNQPLTHNLPPHRPCSRSLQLCHLTCHHTPHKRPTSIGLRLPPLSSEHALLVSIEAIHSHSSTSFQARFFHIFWRASPVCFSILVSSTPIAYPRPAWPMPI